MDLSKELGLENFTEEEKNELLAQFTESLLKRLVVRVYEKLNKEEQAEFDKLAEGGDSGKINEFLTEKVPDMNQVRDEEVAGLLEEMREFIGVAR